MKKIKTNKKSSNSKSQAERLNRSVEEAFALKSEKDRIDARLKELYSFIIAQANFNKDNKTVMLEIALPYVVKVVARDTIKWNQSKLLSLRNELDTNDFERLFKSEYKHQSKQVIDNFILFAPPTQAKAIADAFSLQTTFSVSIEKAKESVA